MNSFSMRSSLSWPACRSESARQLRLQFFRSPLKAVANDLGQLEALELDKTQLVQKGDRQVAISSGQSESLKVIQKSASFLL